MSRYDWLLLALLVAQFVIELAVFLFDRWR